MDSMEKLRSHLNKRTLELAKLKKSGKKIIGYVPGGFVPDELIYAADAIPLCLCKGGDPEPAAEALSCTPRFLCTFCRSQIGYYRLGEALDYKLPDLLLAPIVDSNNKLIADTFDYYTDISAFRYGVPHDKDPDAADYFQYGLEQAKKAIEGVTGNTITDDRLKEEIEFCNKRRSLLKKISYLRVGADPVLSSQEYINLHHASFYADKNTYLELLEGIHEELKAKRVETTDFSGPRIMLIASTMANGDRRIDDTLAETNASVVYEEVSEGMVPYLHNVDTSGGDLMASLTDAYFTKRIKGPWDRPWEGRFEDLLKKVKEFSCDGVIWYQTLYRDGADLQAWSFAKKFKAEGISFAKIETDYTAAEKGPMRTRVETFIELMEQGPEGAEAVI